MYTLTNVQLNWTERCCETEVAGIERQHISFWSYSLDLGGSLEESVICQSERSEPLLKAENMRSNRINSTIILSYDFL